jgi:hypothetical protein
MGLAGELLVARMAGILPGGLRMTLRFWALLGMCLWGGVGGGALAQALPSATRAVSLSGFVAAGERDTGLAGARNTDVTAGVDIGLLPLGGWIPSLELRGSMPVVTGSVAGEREFLGGLQLARPLVAMDGRARVYGNVLIGRGQLDYYGAGLKVPGINVFYTESHSTIVSPGGGLELDGGGNFGLRIDAQFERYGTPVTVSGSAWAEGVTVGLVYRLNLDGRRRRWE